MRKNFRTCLLSCLLPLLVGLPFPTQAAPEEQVTVITSDSLLFDYAKHFAVFKGNVVVVDPDMRLTGDELTVYFSDTDEVQSIVAIGNVVIDMKDLNARSEKATYDLKLGKVILENTPQVTRGRSILQAERIIYWRMENKLVAEPRARVLLFQGDGERNQLNF